MTPRLHSILGLQLTTADPQALARFYTEALGFEAAAPAPIPADELRVLGIEGRGWRVPLRLGDQRLDLDGFERPGRRYPADATAADLCFQHFAIVTSSAAWAWEHARAHGAVSISRAGVVTLPASAGGVTAIKFRDPEGHPLELIEFPPDAPVGWHGQGMLGIDHSAISIHDLEQTQAFFAGRGLSVGTATLNRGPTQMALDALDDVEVDVVPMMSAATPPHLELLRYRIPQGRSLARLAPNDIAGTRIVWQANVDALMRDPAGHLHLLRHSHTEADSEPVVAPARRAKTTGAST